MFKLRILGVLLTTGITFILDGNYARAGFLDSIDPTNPNNFGHNTNKWKERSGLEDGWIVTYSKEFSREEYLKLSTAIVADIGISKGTETYAYFQEFAQESLQNKDWAECVVVL